MIVRDQSLTHRLNRRKVGVGTRIERCVGTESGLRWIRNHGSSENSRDEQEAWLV